MQDSRSPDEKAKVPTGAVPPSHVFGRREETEPEPESPPPEVSYPPEAAPPPSEKPPAPPSRFVYGEMAGAVFWCWIPVFLAFFLPWHSWLPRQPVIGDLSLIHLVVAVIIALPPWIVLLMHLVRGRLADGITDMLLWAIWECLAMVFLCYFYPDRGRDVLWQASSYWEEMRTWLVTGVGTEGDPSKWILVHLRNLVILLVLAFPLGILALVMGVLQLNFMNFYVAGCLRSSDNVLLALPVAWHFWSVVRVVGYIVLASTMFELFLKLFRAPARWRAIWGGFTWGIILIIIDGLMKWQFAESVRTALLVLCDIR